MNLSEFDNQMLGRIVGIKKMAKVDIMGARREVDQLRREFVTALTDVGTNTYPLVGSIAVDIAEELDKLDKFDMIPEKKSKRKKTA